MILTIFKFLKNIILKKKKTQKNCNGILVIRNKGVKLLHFGKKSALNGNSYVNNGIRSFSLWPKKKVLFNNNNLIIERCFPFICCLAQVKGRNLSVNKFSISTYCSKLNKKVIMKKYNKYTRYTYYSELFDNSKNYKWTAYGNYSQHQNFYGCKDPTIVIDFTTVWFFKFGWASVNNRVDDGLVVLGLEDCYDIIYGKDGLYNNDFNFYMYCTYNMFNYVIYWFNLITLWSGSNVFGYDNLNYFNLFLIDKNFISFDTLGFTHVNTKYSNTLLLSYPLNLSKDSMLLENSLKFIKLQNFLGVVFMNHIKLYDGTLPLFFRNNYYNNYNNYSVFSLTPKALSWRQGLKNEELWRIDMLNLFSYPDLNKNMLSSGSNGVYGYINLPQVLLKTYFKLPKKTFFLSSLIDNPNLFTKLLFKYNYSNLNLLYYNLVVGELSMLNELKSYKYFNNLIFDKQRLKYFKFINYQPFMELKHIYLDDVSSLLNKNLVFNNVSLDKVFYINKIYDVIIFPYVLQLLTNKLYFKWSSFVWWAYSIDEYAFVEKLYQTSLDKATFYPVKKKEGIALNYNSNEVLLISSGFLMNLYNQNNLNYSNCYISELEELAHIYHTKLLFYNIFEIWGILDNFYLRKNRRTSGFEVATFNEDFQVIFEKGCGTIFLNKFCSDFEVDLGKNLFNLLGGERCLEGDLPYFLSNQWDFYLYKYASLVLKHYNFQSDFSYGQLRGILGFIKNYSKAVEDLVESLNKGFFALSFDHLLVIDKLTSKNGKIFNRLICCNSFNNLLEWGREQKFCSVAGQSIVSQYSEEFLLLNQLFGYMVGADLVEFTSCNKFILKDTLRILKNYIMLANNKTFLFNNKNNNDDSVSSIMQSIKLNSLITVELLENILLGVFKGYNLDISSGVGFEVHEFSLLLVYLLNDILSQHKIKNFMFLDCNKSNYFKYLNVTYPDSNSFMDYLWDSSYFPSPSQLLYCGWVSRWPKLIVLSDSWLFSLLNWYSSGINLLDVDLNLINLDYGLKFLNFYYKLGFVGLLNSGSSELIFRLFSKGNLKLTCPSVDDSAYFNSLLANTFNNKLLLQKNDELTQLIVDELLDFKIDILHNTQIWLKYSGSVLDNSYNFRHDFENLDKVLLVKLFQDGLINLDYLLIPFFVDRCYRWSFDIKNFDFFLMYQRWFTIVMANGSYNKNFLWVNNLVYYNKNFLNGLTNYTSFIFNSRSKFCLSLHYDITSLLFFNSSLNIFNGVKYKNFLIDRPQALLLLMNNVLTTYSHHLSPYTLNLAIMLDNTSKSYAHLINLDVYHSLSWKFFLVALEEVGLQQQVYNDKKNFNFFIFLKQDLLNSSWFVANYLSVNHLNQQEYELNSFKVLNIYNYIASSKVNNWIYSLIGQKNYVQVFNLGHIRVNNKGSDQYMFNEFKLTWNNFWIWYNNYRFSYLNNLNIWKFYSGNNNNYSNCEQKSNIKLKNISLIDSSVAFQLNGQFNYDLLSSNFLSSLILEADDYNLNFPIGFERGNSLGKNLIIKNNDFFRFIGFLDLFGYPFDINYLLTDYSFGIYLGNGSYFLMDLSSIKDEDFYFDYNLQSILKMLNISNINIFEILFAHSLLGKRVLTFFMFTNIFKYEVDIWNYLNYINRCYSHLFNLLKFINSSVTLVNLEQPFIAPKVTLLFGGKGKYNEVKMHFYLDHFLKNGLGQKINNTYFSIYNVHFGPQFSDQLGFFYSRYFVKSYNLNFLKWYNKICNLKTKDYYLIRYKLLNVNRGSDIFNLNKTAFIYGYFSGNTGSVYSLVNNKRKKNLLSFNYKIRYDANVRVNSLNVPLLKESATPWWYEMMYVDYVHIRLTLKSTYIKRFYSSVEEPKDAISYILSNNNQELLGFDIASPLLSFKYSFYGGNLFLEYFKEKTILKGLKLYYWVLCADANMFKRRWEDDINVVKAYDSREFQGEQKKLGYFVPLWDAPTFSYGAHLNLKNLNLIWGNTNIGGNSSFINILPWLTFKREHKYSAITLLSNKDFIKLGQFLELVNLDKKEKVIHFGTKIHYFKKLNYLVNLKDVQDFGSNLIVSDFGGPYFILLQNYFLNKFRTYNIIDWLLLPSKLKSVTMLKSINLCLVSEINLMGKFFFFGSLELYSNNLSYKLLGDFGPLLKGLNENFVSLTLKNSVEWYKLYDGVLKQLMLKIVKKNFLGKSEGVNFVSLPLYLKTLVFNNKQPFILGNYFLKIMQDTLINNFLYVGSVKFKFINIKTFNNKKFFPITTNLISNELKFLNGELESQQFGKLLKLDKVVKEKVTFGLKHENFINLLLRHDTLLDYYVSCYGEFLLNFINLKTKLVCGGLFMDSFYYNRFYENPVKFFKIIYKNLETFNIGFGMDLVSFNLNNGALSKLSKHFNKVENNKLALLSNIGLDQVNNFGWAHIDISKIGKRVNQKHFPLNFLDFKTLRFDLQAIGVIGFFECYQYDRMFLLFRKSYRGEGWLAYYDFFRIVDKRLSDKKWRRPLPLMPFKSIFDKTSSFGGFSEGGNLYSNFVEQSYLNRTWRYIYVHNFDFFKHYLTVNRFMSIVDGNSNWSYKNLEINLVSKFYSNRFNPGAHELKLFMTKKYRFEVVNFKNLHNINPSGYYLGKNYYYDNVYELIFNSMIKIRFVNGPFTTLSLKGLANLYGYFGPDGGSLYSLNSDYNYGALVLSLIYGDIFNFNVYHSGNYYKNLLFDFTKYLSLYTGVLLFDQFINLLQYNSKVRHGLNGTVVNLNLLYDTNISLLDLHKVIGFDYLTCLRVSKTFWSEKLMLSNGFLILISNYKNFKSGSPAGDLVNSNYDILFNLDKSELRNIDLTLFLDEFELEFNELYKDTYYFIFKNNWFNISSMSNISGSFSLNLNLNFGNVCLLNNAVLESFINLQLQKVGFLNNFSYCGGFSLNYFEKYMGINWPFNKLSSDLNLLSSDVSKLNLYFGFGYSFNWWSPFRLLLTDKLNYNLIFYKNIVSLYNFNHLDNIVGLKKFNTTFEIKGVREHLFKVSNLHYFKFYNLTTPYFNDLFFFNKIAPLGNLLTMTEYWRQYFKIIFFKLYWFNIFLTGPGVGGVSERALSIISWDSLLSLSGESNNSKQDLYTNAVLDKHTILLPFFGRSDVTKIKSVDLKLVKNFTLPKLLIDKFFNGQSSTKNSYINSIIPLYKFLYKNNFYKLISLMNNSLTEGKFYINGFYFINDVTHWFIGYNLIYKIYNIFSDYNYLNNFKFLNMLEFNIFKVLNVANYKDLQFNEFNNCASIFSLVTSMRVGYVNLVFGHFSFIDEISTDLSQKVKFSLDLNYLLVYIFNSKIYCLKFLSNSYYQNHLKLYDRKNLWQQMKLILLNYDADLIEDNTSLEYFHFFNEGFNNYFINFDKGLLSSSYEYKSLDLNFSDLKRWLEVEGFIGLSSFYVNELDDVKKYKSFRESKGDAYPGKNIGEILAVRPGEFNSLIYKGGIGQHFVNKGHRSVNAYEDGIYNREPVWNVFKRKFLSGWYSEEKSSTNDDQRLNVTNFSDFLLKSLKFRSERFFIGVYNFYNNVNYNDKQNNFLNEIILSGPRSGLFQITLDNYVVGLGSLLVDNLKILEIFRPSGFKKYNEILVENSTILGLLPLDLIIKKRLKYNSFGSIVNLNKFNDAGYTFLRYNKVGDCAPQLLGDTELGGDRYSEDSPALEGSSYKSINVVPGYSGRVPANIFFNLPVLKLKSFSFGYKLEHLSNIFKLLNVYNRRGLYHSDELMYLNLNWNNIFKHLLDTNIINLKLYSLIDYKFNKWSKIYVQYFNDEIVCDIRLFFKDIFSLLKIYDSFDFMRYLTILKWVNGNELLQINHDGFYQSLLSDPLNFNNDKLRLIKLSKNRRGFTTDVRLKYMGWLYNFNHKKGIVDFNNTTEIKSFSPHLIMGNYNGKVLHKYNTIFGNFYYNMGFYNYLNLYLYNRSSISLDKLIMDNNFVNSSYSKFDIFDKSFIMSELLSKYLDSPLLSKINIFKSKGDNFRDQLTSNIFKYSKLVSENSLFFDISFLNLNILNLLFGNKGEDNGGEEGEIKQYKLDILFNDELYNKNTNFMSFGDDILHDLEGTSLSNFFNSLSWQDLVSHNLYDAQDYTKDNILKDWFVDNSLNSLNAEDEFYAFSVKDSWRGSVIYNSDMGFKPFDGVDLCADDSFKLYSQPTVKNVNFFLYFLGLFGTYMVTLDFRLGSDFGSYCPDLNDWQAFNLFGLCGSFFFLIFGSVLLYIYIYCCCQWMLINLNGDHSQFGLYNNGYFWWFFIKEFILSRGLGQYILMDYILQYFRGLQKWLMLLWCLLYGLGVGSISFFFNLFFFRC